MPSTVTAALPVRRHALAVAAAALAATLSVQAQTPAPAAADDKKPAAAKEAEAPATIIVRGTRASQQGSIQRKKNASTVADSIVAEDVDQFPDKNVGEALSRVSGVQLTREFGEGSQVSIRGVEPNLNRVEINGLSVLGTNGGAGRGAELRELAAELISSIDVVKGTTADMTEGGVGGTVQITTRKPLDFTGRVVSMSLAAEKGSTRDGLKPRGTLLLADKFLDGRLGVMANIVYDNVLTRNDYARNTSWNFLRDWDFSADRTIRSLDPDIAAVTTKAGCAALPAAKQAGCQQQWFDYAPRTARYGIWERDHKRSSGEFTLQYKFTDEFDAYASYQRNVQRQRLNDMNFGTDLTSVNRLSSAGTAPTYSSTAVPSGGTCTGVSTTATPSGMVVTDHQVNRYVAGNCLYVTGQGGEGAFSTSARDFKLNIDSTYTTAGFNFKADRWKVSGLVADSKSDYKSESNNIVLTQNAPGLIVELDAQKLPKFNFPAAYNPESSSSYTQAQLQYRPTATFNTERQGKLDFQYGLNHDHISRLMFGVQARDSSSKQYTGGGYLVQNNGLLSNTEEASDINALTANINQTLIWDPLYTGNAQRPNATQTLINGNHRTRYVNAATMRQLVESVSGRSPGTFFGGYGGVSNMPANWISPVYQAAYATGAFDTSKFNYDNLYTTQGSNGNRYPQIPAWDVKEKIQAAYARLDFGAELGPVQLDGNVGLRYARTEVRSGGLFSDRIRIERSVGSATFDDRVRANTIVSIDNTYNDLLPSLNVTAGLLGGKLLVRGGIGKVMSRPALDLLAPNVTCTINSGRTQFGGDGVDDCTAGNPDLKPYRATKFDLSVEYYPSRDTQLSAALFQTKIDTYVRTGVVSRTDFFGDGVVWDVQQPVNGKGAKTYGLELAGRTALTFLPSWMSGFGVDTNLTLMSYKYAAGQELLSTLDGTQLPYPGLSKTAYNVGLWYDEGMVNARLAYHFRDKYYTGANDVTGGGNPIFRDKTGYLDAKLQLRMSKQITLSFEAKNLTNQAELAYAGSLSRPTELAWSGRRYYVTLGAKL